MRTLSIARVATACLGLLAIVVLMLAGASGLLQSTPTPVAEAPRVNMDNGRMPARALEGAPDSEEALPPNAEPRMNMTGDEVSPALATYGIDRDGNLFEVHSPQTEEPRLAAPVG